MDSVSAPGSENVDVYEVGAFAFDLDDLDEPPPTDSFDFFRRTFFGRSGVPCDDESDSRLESLGCRFVLELLDDLLDCLDLVDGSRVGLFVVVGPSASAEEWRLVDSGDASLSFNGELCDLELLRHESTKT